jgi:hypothetical protein
LRVGYFVHHRIVSSVIRVEFDRSHPVVLYQYNNNNNNLDWGPVPHFYPLEALQPVWLMPEAYCTIPCFSKRSHSDRQVPLASTIRGSPPSSQRRNYGREMVARWCLGYIPRVLLHAANLRHGTDNFTALPKEGVLRIFIAL